MILIFYKRMEKLFSFLSMASILCLSFTSCENAIIEDGELSSGGTDENVVTKVVSLGINDEHVDYTQTDMSTRASAASDNTYYGFNVYLEDGKTYTKYAYGLFDNKTDISLVLEEGKKYKIECLEIKEGNDKLYNINGGFGLPFTVNKKPTTVKNSFLYSSKNNLDALTSGEYSTGADDTLWYPRAVTSYGCVEDFDPQTADNVTLDLKRAVFGYHFKIQAPKDGTATISFLNDFSITISAGDPVYESEDIYSFHGIVKAVGEDDYTGNDVMKVTWTYSNGETRNYKHYVPITRNKITNLSLDFQGGKSDGVSLNEDTSGYGTVESTWTVGKD